MEAVGVLVAGALAKSAVSAAGGALIKKFLDRLKDPGHEELRRQMEFAGGIIAKIEDYGEHSEVVNQFYNVIAEGLNYLDTTPRPDPAIVNQMKLKLFEYINLLIAENSVLCSNVFRNNVIPPDNAITPELRVFPFAQITSRISISQEIPTVLYRGHFQSNFQTKPIFIKAIELRSPDENVDYSNFKREALILQLLEEFHGVVSFYGVDNKDRPTQIVYEAGKCSLREYLVELKSASLREKVEILTECCAIFGHLVSRGILHRDIKPENILILEGNRVKIMNFGFVKATVTGVTAAIEKKGTHAYMAPEILLHSEKTPHPYSEASDVYSFAVMMNEVLTDTVPFQVGLTVLMRMMHSSNCRPVLLTSENYEDCADTCVVLSHFIKMCWHLDPKMRFSFALLHNNLKALF